MMKPIIKGKVWKFGDNIGTDYIMPGFTQGATPEERATFCMRAIRPDFAKEIKPGDVIVGGKNFGCGSSRPAARNFMTLGISCVIAESFARTFFRISVHLGFPILYCKGVSTAFAEGDILEANFKTGEVKNLTSGKVLQAEPLPEIAMRILDAGGVVELLKKEYAKK
ncbi:MAG: 3-isopropylmalate dehydratase [Chloroflexota bacterium]